MLTVWVKCASGDSEGRKVYTLWDLYHHADFVTYPSTYEGFGNALLEAIYFRKPVLINRYSIFVRDIEPKGFRLLTMDGFVTPTIARQVRQILTDSDLCQEVVNHNYEIARQFYSYSTIRSNLRAFIADLTDIKKDFPMSYFTQTAIKHISSTRLKLLRRRLGKLYGVERADRLLDRMYQMIGRYGVGVGLSPSGQNTGLSQQDVVLITYADMVQSKGRAPLDILREFCSQHLKGAVSTVHLLPFYPWTSDDGFSVVDYRQVHPDYGKWNNIENFSKEFQLMFDLVLNHCSSKSPWFKEFVSGVEPGMNYIMEGDPEADLSAVVRPRSSPLLTPYQTRGGEKNVWTTFSADQVDLDWTCPDLLFEFLDIILFYLSMGCRILRLDAVAFLWKNLVRIACICPRLMR